MEEFILKWNTQTIIAKVEINNFGIKKMKNVRDTETYKCKKD